MYFDSCFYPCITVPRDAKVIKNEFAKKLFCIWFSDELNFLILSLKKKKIVILVYRWNFRKNPKSRMYIFINLMKTLSFWKQIIQYFASQDDTFTHWTWHTRHLCHLRVFASTVQKSYRKHFCVFRDESKQNTNEPPDRISFGTLSPRLRWSA